MLRSARSTLIAVGLVLGGIAAAVAANTTFFTSIGDLVFPFKPPTSDGSAGTIDNMTIGATTPRGVNATTLTATTKPTGAGITALMAAPGAIGGTTPAAGAFTTLAASGAVSGAGFTALLASPPAIGGTVAAAGSFTTLTNTGHVITGSTAPAPSSCGTGTPAVVGSDRAGEITLGTGTPTGCVVTFASAYVSAPFCTVTWQSNLASMIYSVSNTAITLTQTATSSNKVNYTCVAQSGG